jgi:Putative auto-transporter adhesin, head GIN domain
MRILFIVLATCVATFSYGQEFKKHIKTYNSLIVSRGIDARLVKSDSKDLIFTSRGISPNDVIVENRNNELRIKIATKALWQEMQDNHWWVRVDVPYQTLVAVESLTGAKVSSPDPVQSESLDLAASMGGEIELIIAVKELFIDASMGGLAEVEGTAETIDATASMGSELDLEELIAKFVKAKSTMGSDMRINATEEFDGRASMGGYIRVYGKPDRFYENTNMGGDISSER